MYKTCVYLINKTKKNAIPATIMAIILLAGLKFLVPSYYQTGLCFILLCATLLSLFATAVSVVGILADSSEESNWITQSNADNSKKAYLLHCHRALYTLSMVKAGLFIIVAGILGYIAFTQYTVEPIVEVTNGVVSVIIFSIAFAITDLWAAFLAFSAYTLPWKQYKEYYRNQNGFIQ